MALLHLLKEIYCPDELVVAHLNHRLRPEADDDAQFVVDTAVTWGIPCQVKEIDVAELAHKKGLSIEEAGRQARFRFFAEVAKQMDATTIAVGHNADDQAETVLIAPHSWVQDWRVYEE